MTVNEAIKVAENFNDWRRGAEIEQPNPKEIGVAIDILVQFAKDNVKK